MEGMGVAGGEFFSLKEQHEQVQGLHGGQVSLGTAESVSREDGP